MADTFYRVLVTFSDEDGKMIVLGEITYDTKEFRGYVYDDKVKPLLCELLLRYSMAVDEETFGKLLKQLTQETKVEQKKPEDKGWE